ncbi:MAG: hypothetical protein WAL71_07350 [Terriglobales bacterium]|jgi:hypothetical protein
MSKGRARFTVFLLVVFVLCAFYTFNRRMLESDPVVAKALSSAPTEAKSLLDALDAYHLAHGVYPRSVKDLPRDPLWGKYLYQVNSLFAVYKSLDCQRRMHDLMGIQTPEKIRLGKETQAECLLGYSQFVVKTHVQAKYRQVFAFVVFDSANPKWAIDWCTPNNETRNYCYEDLLKLQDESRQ